MPQASIPNTYALFWFQDGEPLVWFFNSDQMGQCMQEAEALRKRQRAGEKISHVNFCSENPDSVGHPGASDPHPEYSKHHWKRRIDPNEKLGRPSGSLKCMRDKTTDCDSSDCCMGEK